MGGLPQLICCSDGGMRCANHGQSYQREVAIGGNTFTTKFDYDGRENLKQISDGGSGSEFEQFGIQTKGQLQEKVEEVMRTASEQNTVKVGFKIGYYDPATKILVIFDLSNKDHGTVFVADDEYFRGLEERWKNEQKGKKK